MAINKNAVEDVKQQNYFLNCLLLNYEFEKAPLTY